HSLLELFCDSTSVRESVENSAASKGGIVAKQRIIMSRMDSVDDELTSFFGSLEISQSPDDIITNMNRENITVRDLASMDRNDLYGFGVKTFKDANRILERARSHKKLVKQGSWSQEERRPQLVRQESRDYGRAGNLKMRLMDVRPGVRDVFAAQLDGNVEGVPNWEQFGEKLLNMDTVTLRQFKSSASPTKAILNKEIGDDPSATLEDAFEALKAIGRNDVVSLVLEKLDSRNSSMSREGSEDRTSPPNHPSTLLVDQRLHRTEPCTDRDTGVTAQQNVCFDPALEQRMQTITAQSTLPPKQSSLEKKVHRHDSFDQTTAVSSEVPKSPKDLYSLLKDMTSDENRQTIKITCKVFNSTTNQLIKGETPWSST
ncbi:hypothetical protein GBAR_LOCUS14465, partial [Geodia barretti]